MEDDYICLSSMFKEVDNLFDKYATKIYLDDVLSFEHYFYILDRMKQLKEDIKKQYYKEKELEDIIIKVESGFFLSIEEEAEWELFENKNNDIYLSLLFYKNSFNNKLNRYKGDLE